MKKFLRRIRLALPRVFSDIASKINDEVLLLALGLSIVVAMIAIYSHPFPEWAGITLVLMFLIGAIYFLLSKIAQRLIGSKRPKTTKFRSMKSTKCAIEESRRCTN